MRILQNNEIIHISGGLDVESGAKWGGKIGGVLGGAVGSFGGLYVSVGLGVAGVNPFLITPLLLTVGGLAGFTLGTYSGYMVGAVGTIGCNALVTASISNIYSI